jgi:transposase
MAAFKNLAPVLRAAPDEQILLTDPDARSMATSGRGRGIVGYNVQIAADAELYLVVAHEVTIVGHDREQLSSMAARAKAGYGRRGSRCARLSRLRQGRGGHELIGSLPMFPTLDLRRQCRGRFGKQHFIYVPENDTYRCPAGEAQTSRYTTVENEMNLQCYWTTKWRAARPNPRARPESSAA